jgi:aconitate hydratase
VVAFALVGHTRINFDNEPLGTDQNGHAVYLRDIWPSDEVVNEALSTITQESYASSYKDMLVGDAAWENLPLSNSVCYPWNDSSTYIVKPPFLEALAEERAERDDSAESDSIIEESLVIESANILAILGDSITTDHISPAGKISAESPAGKYLISQGLSAEQFNSYGARRGHHEVMVRGTFANNRLKNKIVAPKEGGMTRIVGKEKFDNEVPVSIFEASQHYQKSNTPLVIFAGKEYGTGSSRDWAAKGCQLLGIKAVIAESFERIHRSNLVGMGIMPLLLPKKMSLIDLHLHGDEKIDLMFTADSKTKQLSPNQILQLIIHADASSDSTEPVTVPVTLNINNALELRYFLAGGVLPYVASQLL